MGFKKPKISLKIKNHLYIRQDGVLNVFLNSPVRLLPEPTIQPLRLRGCYYAREVAISFTSDISRNFFFKLHENMYTSLGRFRAN